MDGVPFSTGESQYAPIVLDSIAIQWLMDANMQLPPYWSTSRDAWMRQFWTTNDIIGIAVNTFVQRVQSIPFKIFPKNPSISSHIDSAETFYKSLMVNSGLGQTWRTELSKFIQDYLTQDNGAFLLIMGGGAGNAPLIGPVLGVYHLDSKLCTRTGDKDFPIIYNNPVDGKKHKLHHTRIIILANQPSPRQELFGVGYSPLSSCIQSGSEIGRIMRYYEEKMGARPPRQILYVKKGATLDQLSGAISAWRVKMDTEGTDMFGRTLLVAPKSASSELELGVLDLASTPDGFDRQSTVTMDAAIVASAFGLNLADLSLNVSRYGASSENNTQHLRGYSKGIATFLSEFQLRLDLYVMPQHLKCEFDYIDDEQDARRTDIHKTAADTRKTNLDAGVLTPRIARMQMVETTEITRQQFVELELADGRLPSGSDVLTLFYSEEQFYVEHLNIGVENPILLDYDLEEALRNVYKNIVVVSRLLENARTDESDYRARSALSALTKLRIQIEAKLGTNSYDMPDNTLSDGVSAEAIDDQTNTDDLFGGMEGEQITENINGNSTHSPRVAVGSSTSATNGF